MSIISFLLVFLKQVLNILLFAIFARVLMSWISPQGVPGRLGEILYQITEPVLKIARFLPHRIGLIDLSPLIAMIGIDLLRTFFIPFLQNLFS